MLWKPYRTPSGTHYDLDHLHPQVVGFRLPATTRRPSRDIQVRVTYGLHCFTRDPKPDEQFPPSAVYFRNREQRLFCADRWMWSLALPGIVRTIDQRNCYETNRRNHVLFSTATCDNGDEYAVFFAVRRAGSDVPQDLNMLLISAHARRGFRPGGKPDKVRDVMRATLGKGEAPR
jgi:hypothetical protein